LNLEEANSEKIIINKIIISEREGGGGFIIDEGITLVIKK
jgi:hypothetical protein